jgi:hypothetical protein
MYGPKRKRSGSSSYLQPPRPKKVPRELVPDLQRDDDMEMEDVVVSPPPIDAAIRVNGTSTVAGAAAIAAATKALSDSEEWQNTIERIVKSVVSIRFCQVRLKYYFGCLLIVGFSIRYCKNHISDSLTV